MEPVMPPEASALKGPTSPPLSKQAGRLSGRTALDLTHMPDEIPEDISTVAKLVLENPPTAFTEGGAALSQLQIAEVEDFDALLEGLSIDPDAMLGEAVSDVSSPLAQDLAPLQSNPQEATVQEKQQAAEALYAFDALRESFPTSCAPQSDIGQHVIAAGHEVFIASQARAVIVGNVQHVDTAEREQEVSKALDAVLASPVTSEESRRTVEECRTEGRVVTLSQAETTVAQRGEKRADRLMDTLLREIPSRVSRSLDQIEFPIESQTIREQGDHLVTTIPQENFQATVQKSRTLSTDQKQKCLRAFEEGRVVFQTEAHQPHEMRSSGVATREAADIPEAHTIETESGYSALLEHHGEVMEIVKTCSTTDAVALLEAHPEKLQKAGINQDDPRFALERKLSISDFLVRDIPSCGRLIVHTPCAPEDREAATKKIREGIEKDSSLSSEYRDSLLKRIDDGKLEYMTEKEVEEARKKAEEFVQQFVQWFEKRVHELEQKKSEKKEGEDVSPSGFAEGNIQGKREAVHSVLSLNAHHIALMIALKNFLREQRREEAQRVKERIQHDEEFRAEMKERSKKAQLAYALVLKETLTFFRKKADVQWREKEKEAKE